jgi:uncharacterized delta-60 repeat protein
MIACIFLSISCSKARSPVEPGIAEQEDLIAVMEIPFNRTVYAVYDVVIDPIAKTFTVTPIDRSSQYHFPLTQLYPNVLTVTGYGFTPNFWADIKITHPLPNSGIDGFDPRVISILPANTGVRFIYPVLGVGGNNAVILEPDGYTKLFDELGGSMLGNVNPFKAYFKNVDYRRWFSGGTGYQSDTRRWEMDLNGFGGPMQFKLVVDVSTNYPSPPTPVTDNAPEPISIDAQIGRIIKSQEGIADVYVTLLDWQGYSTISSVKAECPELFDSVKELTYLGEGKNSYEYVYTTEITNEKLAPSGDYRILIAASDQTSGIFIYNEFLIMVRDYLPDGNLIWAKRAGGTGNDYGMAIASLSDNSTVVTGKFIAPATFGPGEPNETVLNVYSGMFLARYNPDGTLAWVKNVDGSMDNEGYGITVLSDDSIVVTGEFRSTATFGPGEVNETVLTSFGQIDIFIARYNQDGTIRWAKNAGGEIHDGGRAIAALSDNSTVITGYFEGPATFGAGEPNQTVLNSKGIFIARYNSDGSLIWAKQTQGDLMNNGRAVCALSDDSFVVTGWFEYTTIFGKNEPGQTSLTSEGASDIFVARYDQSGILIWAKRAGGYFYDQGYSITTLSDDSTVTTGCFVGWATFGDGEPNETILSPYGGIFIARYNPNGTLAWAKYATDNTRLCWSQAITSLSDDSIIITGHSHFPITFGEGEPNETLLIDPNGFLARYNSDGSLAWAKKDCGMLGTGLDTLTDDSVVATGELWVSTKFGAGEPGETTLTTAGSRDIFIARFAP